MLWEWVTLAFSLIFVFAILVYLLSTNPMEIDASEILEELNKTEVGKLKLKAAKQQAEKNGVGIVIHEGNMYTIRGQNCPKPNTWQYYKAVEKSMEEKQGIYRKD